MIEKFKANKFLNRKRKGYAIAFEVMITLVLVVVYLQLTLYSLVTMNAQRYMTSVLTSTTIQTAKWGGTSTNAYYVNQVGGGTSKRIDQNANVLLQREGYDRMFGATIEASPKCISSSNDNVTVTLRFHFPSFNILSMAFVTGDKTNQQFMTGRDQTYRLQMHSIMRPGILLTAGGACSR